MSIPTPEWVTPAEAAEIARVSLSTIYTWISDGKVRAKRSPGGGRTIVASEDLTWKPVEAAQAIEAAS